MDRRKQFQGGSTSNESENQSQQRGYDRTPTVGQHGQRPQQVHRAPVLRLQDQQRRRRPGGIVISEKLRAQVAGLNQAISNAGDAVNMVKTAEGALTEVNTLLGNIRTLAVHAANAGANDTATVDADQTQIASALASINNIASETQFGGKKLLDGSAGIITTVTGLQWFLPT